MLNRSREVTCSTCSGINFWKGNPEPTSSLHCRYCDSFVTTYDEYIRSAIQREAEQLLAQFTEARTADDLAYLKRVLAEPEQRLSA
ncbi:hypothetical protein MHM84_06380 [Halomonas sp. McH1-25]|uniref:hypothetical protein n=1 Tax=unclassified Halomonas TaxID=2609666 RepID=UPI001EF44B27|nr:MULTISPECIES: hypothetical protein [unclassified Halomonas]MCG7599407.1 hypothetical protein [Halomonas sp. McH1-25]MCP1344083.1 hypothetical protein [Halomonas sp. FL8]MCP1362330.1 hypothetical protein [Halomonas sp. BBD45]MCP1365391.1 hypothetical protein [Halomonas sp. BBD48]